MPDFVIDSTLVWIGMAIILAFVSVTFDSIALSRALRRTPDAASDSIVRRPPSRRRLAVGASALVISATAASGIVFAATYDPLRATGPATGSGTAYLGTEPATFGGVDEVVFETLPGGELQMEFGLANTGQVPLTVEGFDNPVAPRGAGENDWFESVVLALKYQRSGGASSFEIQPGATVRVLARFVLKKCAGWDAMPKLGPSQSPSALDALTATTSFYSGGGFMSVPIVYDVLGFRHVSQVVLPAQITIATVDPMACSSGSNPPQSSGVVPPTPVPSVEFP